MRSQAHMYPGVWRLKNNLQCYSLETSHSFVTQNLCGLEPHRVSESSWYRSFQILTCLWPTFPTWTHHCKDSQYTLLIWFCFYSGFRVLNSGPHAHEVRVLLAEMCQQPSLSSFMFSFFFFSLLTPSQFSSLKVAQFPLVKVSWHMNPWAAVIRVVQGKERGAHDADNEHRLWMYKSVPAY